mgnify:CR=1 FL=1
MSLTTLATQKDCRTGLNLKLPAGVRPYVAGTGFSRNTDHINWAARTLPVTESAAVPKPDPTAPIDSGQDPTGPEASCDSPSAQKPEEEKAKFRHADRPRSLAVVAGMGFELAGTTVVLAGLGHLVDRYLGGERSVGFAFGGLIGFGLGMFRFIMKALRQIEKSNA